MQDFSEWHEFMRACEDKVMVSINDHPEVRRVFKGFRMEEMDIRYSRANPRKGVAEKTGELAIMNW